MRGAQWDANLAALRSWAHDLETDEDWQGPRGLLPWAIAELEALALEFRDISKFLEHAALLMPEGASGRHQVDQARVEVNRALARRRR